MKNGVVSLGVLLAVLLSGCATTDTANTSTQMIGDLRIVTFKPAQRQPLYAKASWSEESGWALLSIGTERPFAQDGQEIIGIHLDRKLIGPAYDAWGYINQSTAGMFDCTPQFDDKISTTYHPCGETRLTKTNSAGTAKKAILSIATLGQGRGTTRDLDHIAIQGLAEQTQLLTALSVYQSMGPLYTDAQKAVQQRYAPEIRLIDQSGLSTLTGDDFQHVGGFHFPALPRSFELRSGERTFVEQLELSRAYLMSLRDGLPSIAPPPPWLKDVAFECNPAARYQVKGYALTADCQDRPYTIDQLAAPNATITVFSRDITLPFPAYENRDGRLAISIEEGNRLVLANLTDQFLIIDSIAVYWNDHVVTVDRDRSLSPQSNTRPAPELLSAITARSEIDQARQVSDAKREDLEGQSLQFGIAIAYRGAATDETKTLFRLMPFPVLSLVENAR